MRCATAPEWAGTGHYRHCDDYRTTAKTPSEKLRWRIFWSIMRLLFACFSMDSGRNERADMGFPIIFWPLNLMIYPSTFYRDSSSCTPFYWMLLARQSKNVPGFQTLLLHFEIRDVAPEPLHYFVLFWCSRLLLYYRRTSVLLSRAVQLRSSIYITKSSDESLGTDETFIRIMPTWAPVW